MGNILVTQWVRSRACAALSCWETSEKGACCCCAGSGLFVNRRRTGARISPDSAGVAAGLQWVLGRTWVAELEHLGSREGNGRPQQVGPEQESWFSESGQSRGGRTRRSPCRPTRVSRACRWRRTPRPACTACLDSRDQVGARMVSPLLQTPTASCGEVPLSEHG